MKLGEYLSQICDGTRSIRLAPYHCRTRTGTASYRNSATQHRMGLLGVVSLNRSTRSEMSLSVPLVLHALPQCMASEASRGPGFCCTTCHPWMHSQTLPDDPGTGHAKQVALLKGQGKPLHAIMTMKDTRRGRAYTHIRYTTKLHVKSALPGVRACLVCHKVHEGMLPNNFQRTCMRSKYCCFQYSMHCHASK